MTSAVTYHKLLLANDGDLHEIFVRNGAVVDIIINRLLKSRKIYAQNIETLNLKRNI